MAHVVPVIVKTVEAPRLQHIGQVSERGHSAVKIVVVQASPTTRQRPNKQTQITVGKRGSTAASKGRSIQAQEVSWASVHVDELLLPWTPASLSMEMQFPPIAAACTREMRSFQRWVMR